MEGGESESSSKKLPLEDLPKEDLITKYRGLLIIAQKAKQAKDTLIDENNKLRAELKKPPDAEYYEIIESLTQQKLNLLTSLEEMKNRQKFLDSKFTDYERQLNLADSKISELDTSNQCYKRQVNRLTEENEQLITHLDKLEKQIEELKSIGLEQQQQLLSLEKHNVLLTQAASGEEARREEDDKVVELQKMLAISLEEVKKMQSENKNLGEKLENVQVLVGENDRNMKIIGNELMEKNESIKRLQVELAGLKDNDKCEKLAEENGGFQKTIQHLQNMLAESENVIFISKQEIDEKNKIIEKHMNIVDDLTTELHKNRALVEKLKQDVTNTNNKLSQNQIVSSGVASDLQNANEKLKEKLKCYHTKMIKFVGDVKQLKQSRNELICDFRVYVEQVSTWKEKLNILIKKIQEKEREKRDVERENEALRLQLTKVEHDKETEAKEARNETANVIETLTARNRELTEQIESLLAKVAELEDMREQSSYENVKQAKESGNETAKEIEMLTARNIELSDQIDTLVGKLDELESVKEQNSYENVKQAKENDNELAKEIEMLTARNKELNEQLESLLEKVAELKGVKDQHSYENTKRNEELSAKNAELTEQVGNLLNKVAKLEDANESNNENEKQIGTLRVQNAELSEQVDNLLDELTKVQGEKLQGSNENIKQIEMLTIKNTELREQVETVLDKLAKMESVNEQNTNENLKQIDTLSVQNAELCKQIQILSVELAELKGESQNQQSEVAHFKNLLKDSECEIEKKQALNLDLQGAIEELKHKYKDVTSKLEESSKELNQLRNEMDISNDKRIDAYEEAREKYRQEAVACADENKRLLDENQHLQETVADLQKDIEKSIKAQVQKIEVFAEECRKMSNENENLCTKIKLNEDERERLSRSLDESGKLIEKLQFTIQARNETVDALEMKVTELTTAINNRREANVIDNCSQTNEIDSTTRNVEEKINSLKRENAELLSEMNEMNQALKERGETISSQQAYYDDLLKKMQAYEVQSSENLEIISKKEEVISELNAEVLCLKQMNNSNAEIKKDEDISVLRNEIQELRERLSSASQLESMQQDNYAEIETMSTSTISKAEDASRMKDLEGSWEERYGKLRNLALKLKGKIRDLTAEVKKEQSEKAELQQKLTKTVQSFQQQVDKLQDDLETSKSESKTYLKKLDSNALDISKDKKQMAANEEIVTKLKSEIDGLNKYKTNTENWKKQVSSKVQSLKKELEANALVKKDFENRISKLNAELEAKDKALKSEIDEHNKTKGVLQESNNECKKQSVLNLEMQDYERSIKELTQKLDKKQELITKLKDQIDSHKTNFNIISDENKSFEGKAKQFESELDAVRSENELYKKKVSELDNILLERDSRILELKHSVENLRSDNEDFSTQLSKTISEHQKVNHSLKAEKEHLKSQNLGLEQQLRNTQETLTLKEVALKEVQHAYENYKVRAQSVLRQNQSRDIGLEEKFAEEAASSKAQVGVLTSELTGLRSVVDNLTIEKSKYVLLNEELHKQIQHLESEIEEHKRLYQDLAVKHQQSIMEHAETVRGLKVNSETLAHCYQQQLSDQETRHNREVVELQSKLDKGNTAVDTIALSPPTMPREEGEGSESVDSSNNNSMHPMPLEKLLNHDSDQEVSFIKKQLLENESKVMHLTALLADTEQDLAKHIQMNKVLKEEIRRQQRSVEREKHAENLEYLKNVVFKFLTLGGGDERTRLVPVLNTILKLSPEETHKLNLVAKGEKGWSNYLPLSWGSPNKSQ